MHTVHVTSSLLNIRVIVLHESSMACLLEGVLAACPSLMLPLKLMLLHKGAHGHMHNPIEQLVLLAALAVIARAIPLRLFAPLHNTDS
jgi:hypothetical protein